MNKIKINWTISDTEVYSNNRLMWQDGDNYKTNKYNAELYAANTNEKLSIIFESNNNTHWTIGNFINSETYEKKQKRYANRENGSGKWDYLGDELITVGLRVMISTDLKYALLCRHLHKTPSKKFKVGNLTLSYYIINKDSTESDTKLLGFNIIAIDDKILPFIQYIEPHVLIDKIKNNDDIIYSLDSNDIIKLIDSEVINGPYNDIINNLLGQHSSYNKFSEKIILYEPELYSNGDVLYIMTSTKPDISDINNLHIIKDSNNIIWQCESMHTKNIKNVWRWIFKLAKLTTNSMVIISNEYHVNTEIYTRLNLNTYEDKAAKFATVQSLESYIKLLESNNFIDVCDSTEHRNKINISHLSSIFDYTKILLKNNVAIETVKSCENCNSFNDYKCSLLNKSVNTNNICINYN